VEIAGHKSGNDAASVIVFMSFQQPKKKKMEMTGARVLTVLCCWLLALSFFESSRSSLMLFGAGEQMRDLSLAP
jgi:hypothetical protein